MFENLNTVSQGDIHHFPTRLFLVEFKRYWNLFEKSFFHKAENEERDSLQLGAN